MTVPTVPHYVPAPATNEDLDWADLQTIDFSNASTLEGRKALTKQVHDAIKNEGFLYIVNHGLTPEQMTRMFNLANYAMVNVPEEEKQKYLSKIREQGEFRGYKPRNLWQFGGGARDEIEQYNMNFREFSTVEHPTQLRPFIPELDAFARQVHSTIIDNLLRIIALTLGLNEEHFVKLNDHSSEAATYLRLVKYYPFSEEDDKKSQSVWLRGHTDFDTLTLLFSQPISALQIMTKSGEWKWVKHVANAVVVNIGDALEFFSGGYYQSTIHRVRQPPEDQKDQPRVGVIYFATPHDKTELRPIAESPLVRSMDWSKLRFVDGKIPTMRAFRQARLMNYGSSQQLRASIRSGVEEQDVGGVVVKHYD